MNGGESWNRYIVESLHCYIVTSLKFQTGEPSYHGREHDGWATILPLLLVAPKSDEGGVERAGPPSIGWLGEGGGEGERVD